MLKLDEQSIVNIVKSSLKNKKISWEDRELLRIYLGVESFYKITESKHFIYLLNKSFPNVSSKTILSRLKKFNNLMYACPIPSSNRHIEGSYWRVEIDTRLVDFVNKNFLIEEERTVPLLELGHSYFDVLGYVIAPTAAMARDIAKVTLGPRAWEENVRFFREGITTKETLNEKNKQVIQGLEKYKTYLQKERARNEWQMENLEASFVYLKEFVDFNS